MMVYVFAACVLISVGVIIYMASKNYGNIDIYYWSMVLIIPVILMGYTFEATASTLEETRIAVRLMYLDSTVLPVLMVFSMLRYLGIGINPWVKTATYIVTFGHLATVWATVHGSLYYSSITILQTNSGTITKMTDGPLKITHYIYLLAMFITIVALMIYCYVWRKDTSRKILTLYGIFSGAGILCYLIESIADVDYSVLPILYAIADVAVTIQYDRIHSHDMDCVIVEQKKEYSKRGYVAFDMQKNLLGYNNIATEFVPEIKGKRIDAGFGAEDERLIEIFYNLIDEYNEKQKSTADFDTHNTTFRCSVTTFCMYSAGKPAGYLVEIQDVTAEQGYMNLIKQYGASLEKDVEDKTKHIQYIQQRIVLGMATIIENRDLNTGGHVKRTSDIIRIILDEMRRQNVGDLDERFVDEIIRSAPMHDLGKISIDSAILNKPARLTDEEYKIMKIHSAKSGEIVLAILDGVEEPHFVETAYKLARFHHERWDGKGYPERLAEYEIPIEARIMAVADVYDALVSKRCYKEPMSFEQAAQIMLEGMGTQFDPAMKPIFEGCRTQLEQYYKEQVKE